MKIGSLFSGIGGLELGLERAGLGRVIWQVEQNEFCRAVLAKHWPDVDRSVTDVRDASPETLPEVDWICGGFPCQDVSVAGDGAGLAGERSGLWYEMCRVIDECQPFGVIAENVAHGRSRYLCEVRSDLRELGYDSTVLIVGARDVGAPHIRERCFVVAYPNGVEVRQRPERQPARRARSIRAEGETEPRHPCTPEGRDTEPGMGGGSDGVSARLDGNQAAAARTIEPFQWPARMGEHPREHEPPFIIEAPTVYQDERLTALGNAVVPQCAEIIGRWILENL